MFSRGEKFTLLTLLLILAIVVFIWSFKDGGTASTEQVQRGYSTPQDSCYLFDFDPNTVTLKELLSLGLSKRNAISLIRYRESGKVFSIKEEVAECYTFTDSTYFALEPYIKIGDEYKSSKRDSLPHFEARKRKSLQQLEQFLLDTVSAEYIASTGVLSFKQAEVLVNWHKTTNIYNMRELRECYVVSNSAANKLEPYIIFPQLKVELVDLNKADSAELRSVRGIGEKSVVAILDYRQRLGGFHSVEQLSEVNIVLESNFEQIITQICCDSCDISKIDVNFAVAKKLIEHPYLSRTAVRRLLKTRQIKGGWSNIVEMTEDNIFTKEEAARLRPYIVFGDYTKPQDQ